MLNTSDPQNAIDQIRAASGIPYGTPTIVCWVPGEREAARDLGVMRYLVKPVSQATLLAAVAEVRRDVRSVLVVDDDPEAVQLFSRMLSTEDGSVRVMRAMNGNQALAVMRKRQPDVVLLDLVMPEMDGFAVLREKEKDARHPADSGAGGFISRSPARWRHFRSVQCVTQQRPFRTGAI